ncbi:uncharacterized protein RSE6_00610 [Rhynchosporium secalis]|uniref:Uncharacterized protein n=1 Tax=Rhynchosporium secalis TaxID=38038 RepID=A0A1E1LVN8_RHYSE|nr:uncharacterized protein RSE6_00610 [Rhynchosporium secalis]
MKTANPAIYDFFRSELRDQSYAIGDVYSKDEVKKAQDEWNILPNQDKKAYPYLTHVKLLSNTWPHLRLLADFMEVTTTPLRWKDLSTVHPTKGADLDPEKKEKRLRDRRERASRTNVCVLNYMASGEIPVPTHCKSIAALKSVLEDRGAIGIVDKYNLRLYVVEDLSRDVIEALGSHLDIEPAFFREHIVDYAWCNIRDRWQDPPSLRVAEGHRRWVQLRYVTARYYQTSEEFRAGIQEAEAFNVLRRPDDDTNNQAVWDDKDAKVGIMRTRASFWLKKGENGEGDIGVLLLDPTVRRGTPLWYGYRNWEPTPSINDEIPAAPRRESLFDDYIHWAIKSSYSQTQIQSQPAQLSTNKVNTHIPMQTLLYLTCAEWLTMTDYIRTRIGIIEWEVSNPTHFLGKDLHIDDALDKLHFWRRVVPLYREMLTDTLQRVFHTPSLDTSSTVTVNNAPPVALSSVAQCTSQAPTSSHHIRADFLRTLSYMEEYQNRIDRLTSVVTAKISIEDSRRSQDDNRNVARLTWLATFFIPLSYVASLFSMQEDLGTLGRTMKVYFATAVPVAAFAMGLAWVLTLPVVLNMLSVLKGKKGDRRT